MFLRCAKNVWIWGYFLPSFAVVVHVLFLNLQTVQKSTDNIKRVIEFFRGWKITIWSKITRLNKNTGCSALIKFVFTAMGIIKLLTYNVINVIILKKGQKFSLCRSTVCIWCVRFWTAIASSYGIIECFGFLFSRNISWCYNISRTIRYISL